MSGSFNKVSGHLSPTPKEPRARRKWGSNTLTPVLMSVLEESAHAIQRQHGLVDHGVCGTVIKGVGALTHGRQATPQWRRLRLEVMPDVHNAHGRKSAFRMHRVSRSEAEAESTKQGLNLQYNTILYFTILYCTVLYYTIPCYAILYYTTLD